jgi:hypothetical protein
MPSGPAAGPLEHLPRPQRKSSGPYVSSDVARAGPHRQVAALAVSKMIGESEFLPLSQCFADFHNETAGREDAPVDALAGADSHVRSFNVTCENRAGSLLAFVRGVLVTP